MTDDLLKRANSLYAHLPVSLQHAVDEDDDSGLEPEELPDGYERLRQIALGKHPGDVA